MQQLGKEMYASSVQFYQRKREHMAMALPVLDSWVLLLSNLEQMTLLICVSFFSFVKLE
jgi:hypothetical protein